MATTTGFLTGQLLLAMPGMRDTRFQKSVVYMCAHNADGAMGLVVNKRLEQLTMRELLEHLEVTAEQPIGAAPVHFGGPVETARGFVLHSADYREESTLLLSGNFALTATLDVLRAVSQGKGPRRMLLALGHANWAPGQLDAEIQANAWLNAPADERLVFDIDNDLKWERAIACLGIDPGMLSVEAGHA